MRAPDHIPTPGGEPGPLRTALVAVLVCLVCSAVVSSTAVLLRPLQQANREAERRQGILAIVSRQPGLERLFSELGDASLEARVVELDSGAFADWIDPAGFDPRRAALDPLESVALPPGRDLAGLRRRARYAVVYLVRHGEQVELMILPVSGRGYASTLSGYVALAADGNTLRGLTFHEHGETPGLGAQIDDPAWLARWVGKRVRDEQGRLRIGVGLGALPPGSPDSPYLVDCLTGATMTSDGVGLLLRFWLGDDGFAPFLARWQP